MEIPARLYLVVHAIPAQQSLHHLQFGNKNSDFDKEKRVIRY